MLIITNPTILSYSTRGNSIVITAISVRVLRCLLFVSVSHFRLTGRLLFLIVSVPGHCSSLAFDLIFVSGSVPLLFNCTEGKEI